MKAERFVSIPIELALCAVGVWLAACGSSAEMGPADAGEPPDVVDATGPDSEASSEDVVDGSAVADRTTDEGSTSDAADAGATSDEGGLPRCAPLADGKGNLELKTSGGLALDVHLGNEDACNASWSSMGGLLVTFFVPVTADDGGALPAAALSINVLAAQPGMVTTGAAASVDFLSSGHIWNGTDECVADISMNQSLDGGSAYEVTGSLSCSRPLPEAFGNTALTIVKLSFVVAATPS
jgi:hypothetical protein